MRQAQKFENKNSVAETTTLRGTASVDDDLLKALTSDEGFMRAGAMPTVQTASKAGCKTLLDAVSKAMYFSSTSHGVLSTPYPSNRLLSLRTIDATDHPQIVPLFFNGVHCLSDSKTWSRGSTSEKPFILQIKTLPSSWFQGMNQYLSFKQRKSYEGDHQPAESQSNPFFSLVTLGCLQVTAAPK